jgi:hypothetical protein
MERVAFTGEDARERRDQRYRQLRGPNHRKHVVRDTTSEAGKMIWLAYPTN